MEGVDAVSASRERARHLKVCSWVNDRSARGDPARRLGRVGRAGPTLAAHYDRPVPSRLVVPDHLDQARRKSVAELIG